ncbi:MAG: 2'-5' RNA ligase family protein [Verrucomicrobia bacterium]|nr:2'-5' RNA ligase family protein [Verrucomicrobiota bacterium]
MRPLMALQRRWEEGLPRRLVRWVSEHQFHITLLFFGRVARERMDELTGRLADATADCPALPLGLIGVGVFPDWRHPRVLWTGVDGELAELAALQRRIWEVGRACGEARGPRLSRSCHVGASDGPGTRGWRRRAPGGGQRPPGALGELAGD